MIKIAMVSQKGGAGKSTLALHLATEGATRGRKVLLLDLDPQGNLVGWAHRRGDAPPDVDAIHASKLLAQIAEADAEGYDLLVLDTAPSADRASVLAAEAADLILIPCRPAQFDLDAIKATLATARATKRRHMVVLNAAPIRSRVVDEAAALVTGDGSEVSRAIIRQRVAFQHCLTDGATAAEFEPGGAAAQEISALYDDMMKCVSDGTSTRRAA
jgi:chromosome partitioning protein